MAAFDELDARGPVGDVAAEIVQARTPAEVERSVGRTGLFGAEGFDRKPPPGACNFCTKAIDCFTPGSSPASTGAAMTMPTTQHKANRCIAKPPVELRCATREVIIGFLP
jgi:hypothetical protein